MEKTSQISVKAPVQRPLGLRARLAVKRLLDIAMSSLILVCLLPVLVLISLAILVRSGRPILFRQTRVGRDGVPFTMVKFRTMTVDADKSLDVLLDSNERTGPLFKASNDPRVTTVGRVLRRTSLDELPQLFNVLAGTMSMVGPRPALPSEVAQFPPELRVRESMPQGLTGLWQIEGRTDAEFATYAQLDIRYVETWSLRRDFMILLRTPFVVVKHALSRSEVQVPTGATADSGGDRVTSRLRLVRRRSDQITEPAPALLQIEADGADLIEADRRLA